MQLLIENEVTDQPLSPAQEALIRRTILKTLEIEEFDDNVEISLTFMDAAGIKAINKEFREKDEVTDVLSFPQYSEEGWDAYEDDPVFLGDIVICMERAVAQALEFGHPVDREIAYLVCHSTLHLLGYDHIEGEDKTAMRQQEELVMSALGLLRVLDHEQ